MLSRTPSQNIRFFFQVKRFTISRTSFLKSSIHSLFISEGKLYDSLVYVFCSDEYLLDLNKQFLEHNYYTDIVTFNLAPDKAPVVGECYISIERVKDNAKRYHTSFYKELLRVMFHGALHLCGYSDKSDKDTLLMRSKEDHYINLFLAT